MNKTINNNNNSTSTSTSNTYDDIATPPSLAPSSSSSSQFTPPSTNRVVDMNTGSTIPSSFIGVSVLMLLVMLCMLRNWQIQKRKQDEDNNGTNNNGSSSRRRFSITRTSGHSSVHPSSRIAALGSGIQLLSLENCIEMYNKTFDSNGNQLILQQKHIITKTMKQDNSNDNSNSNGNGNGNGNNTNADSGTEGIVEQENRSESFVDIELGSDDNDHDKKDNDDNSLSIYLSFESDHKKKKNTGNTNTNTSTMINGTCSICLEDFVQDDVIVWSNDSACTHIYHKKCMVNYLATNCAQRKVSSSLNITDNPCPTCRRPNYCLVSDDDLVQIVSSLQPKTTQ